MKLPHRIFLATLSGVLVPLAFAPYGLWPLIGAAVALLLLAVRNSTPRQAFYLGLLQGIVGYGLTLYWFIHIFILAALPLFAILGLFTGLFCVLNNVLLKSLRTDIYAVLTTATLWTAIEFYRSELFSLRFPWTTPGVALGPTFLSPLLGVYGASFLIVLAVTACTRRHTFAGGAVLVLIIVGLGLWRPARIEPDTENSVGVAVVQSEECNFSEYLALSRSVKAEAVDLIVWPEYALPYDVRKSDRQLRELTELCAELQVILVLGTTTTVGPGTKEWYNTALVLDQHGVLGEYYKMRPVHFFNDGIPGSNASPIKTTIGVLGTPVCFDCDYSAVLRQLTYGGAEFFVAPTFDAAGWSATQHWQHAALFRLRAVENGRWLACAASSGVSQIIDPHGQVHCYLPPFAPGVLSYRLTPRQQMTFYTRYGWLFPWLTTLAAVILLAGAAIRSTMAKLAHVGGSALSTRPSILDRR